MRTVSCSLLRQPHRHKHVADLPIYHCCFLPWYIDDLILRSHDTNIAGAFLVHDACNSFKPFTTTLSDTYEAAVQVG